MNDGWWDFFYLGFLMYILGYMFYFYIDFYDIYMAWFTIGSVAIGIFIVGSEVKDGTTRNT